MSLAFGEECKTVRSRIFVVEDDASISDVVCSTLQGEGYGCHPAYSGTEANVVEEKATITHLDRISLTQCI